jgi:hypothetical protein
LQVEHIKKYLPKVLPKGDTLILDGEVLLWDPKAQMPLPFGSLKYGLGDALRMLAYLFSSSTATVRCCKSHNGSYLDCVHQHPQEERVHGCDAVPVHLRLSVPEREKVC